MFTVPRSQLQLREELTHDDFKRLLLGKCIDTDQGRFLLLLLLLHGAMVLGILLPFVPTMSRDIPPVYFFAKYLRLRPPRLLGPLFSGTTRFEDPLPTPILVCWVRGRGGLQARRPALTSIATSGPHTSGQTQAGENSPEWHGAACTAGFHEPLWRPATSTSVQTAHVRLRHWRCTHHIDEHVFCKFKLCPDHGRQPRREVALSTTCGNQ